MADLIVGSDYNLNPAEAFVFGCSALLHDAGMTIAAFPGGLDELSKTAEWQDAEAFIKKKLEQANGVTISDLPDNIKRQVNFTALRALHAENAERLLDINWQNGKTGAPQRLLDDEALRAAYSRSIGRIAHSHHWSFEKLLDNLNHAVGAAPEIDGNWPIDEVKIALILRCADAAHIDRRRAPSFDFALSKPTGLSFDHWAFQNRLNAPTVVGEELFFSSGTDFPVEEAGAWWLCYDALRILNKEVSGSNAILVEMGSPPFLVKRVHGADSPRIMAKRIRPQGWKPVDAEIRVSAPAELAKTLGGKNLYGSGPLAPIRELLQNSVDAIRARRVHEQDPDLGQIKISIDLGQGGQKWLHIEDDGVGMSERVLTGPLLDFGQSFWSSAAVQQEFPGLLSKGMNPIGKFGIGFFSIFLLGDHVKVVSRRFDAARSETKVLEFSSLDARPILRAADSSENLKSFSTRVSVAIKENLREIHVADDVYPGASVREYWDLSNTLSKGVRHLVSPLDVRVEFEDDTASSTVGFLHKAEWGSTSPDIFLGELLSRSEKSDVGEVIYAHAPQVRNLTDAEGRHFGRGALDMLHGERDGRLNGCYISVGGFCSPGTYRRTLGDRPLFWAFSVEKQKISAGGQRNTMCRRQSSKPGLQSRRC
ncbi:ATP-binding protein [Bosea vestrisii]|nr:ATP-binding protein [Bosea vestrisii]WID98160.1 ATP-binding protein [Bosea vestrisii]